MLAYRMPRDPSNPRVALWRKLRRLGAIQLVDGLVALPAAAHTIEQFDWLAEEVTEAGGEATTWIARATSAGQERMVARRMADAAAQEYRAVATEASAALEATPAASKRVLARLRRELRRIAVRDHFPPAEREEAHRKVRELAESVGAGGKPLADLRQETAR